MVPWGGCTGFLSKNQWVLKQRRDKARSAFYKKFSSRCVKNRLERRKSERETSREAGSRQREAHIFMRHFRESHRIWQWTEFEAWRRRGEGKPQFLTSSTAQKVVIFKITKDKATEGEAF